MPVGRQASDKELIYQRYLQAFKKGAYNYIKEEMDPATQQMIPKKYFSGGAELIDVDSAMIYTANKPPSKPGLEILLVNMKTDNEDASIGIIKASPVKLAVIKYDPDIGFVKTDPAMTTLSGQGYIMFPRTDFKGEDHMEPLIAESLAKFDFKRYEKPHDYTNISTFDHKESILTPMPNVTHLAIKISGSMVVLPKEFRPIRSIIQKIIDHSKANDPFFDTRYIYLTVLQSDLKGGEAQIQAGKIPRVHADGIQRGPERTPPDYIYLASASSGGENLGTVIYPNPFNLWDAKNDFDARNIEPDKRDYTLTMQEQAKHMSSYRMPEGTIGLFNAYVAHQVPVATKPAKRVVIRLRIASSDAFISRPDVTPSPFNLKQFSTGEYTLRKGGIALNTKAPFNREDKDQAMFSTSSVSQNIEELKKWAENFKGQKIEETQQEIADRFRVPQQKVSSVFKEYGIQSRGIKELEEKSEKVNNLKKWAEDLKGQEIEETQQAIADKFGVSRVMVNRILNEYGIKLKEPENIKKLHEWAEGARGKIIKETQKEIAARFGVAELTVARIREKYDIEVKGSENIKKLREWAEKTRGQEIDQKQKEIAEEFGVSMTKVSEIFGEFNIKSKGRGKEESENTKKFRQWVESMKGQEIKKAQKEIAEEFNVPEPTVSIIFEEYGRRNKRGGPKKITDLPQWAQRHKGQNIGKTLQEIAGELGVSVLKVNGIFKKYDIRTKIEMDQAMIGSVSFVAEKLGLNPKIDRWRDDTKNVFNALFPKVWHAVNKYGAWKEGDTIKPISDLERLGVAVYDGNPESIRGKDVVVILGARKEFDDALASVGIHPIENTSNSFWWAAHLLGENILQHAPGYLGALVVVRDENWKKIYLASVDAGSNGFFEKDKNGQWNLRVFSNGRFVQRPGSLGEGVAMGAISVSYGATIISHGQVIEYNSGDYGTFQGSSYNGADGNVVKRLNGTAVILQRSDSELNNQTVKQKSDLAMRDEGLGGKHEGGINFNPNKINLQIQGSSNGIKFRIDPAMLQQLRNVPGFVPVIISVKPLVDLQGFLDVSNVN